MSRVEIILSIATTALLIALMLLHKENTKLLNRTKVKIHTCLYNENSKCYEKACGYCKSKKECNICCGGNCNKCSAHSVEYIERSQNK